MDTQTIFDSVKDLIFQSKNIPGLEIEMRLGKMNGNFFDTNVGQQTFNKILEALEQFQHWEEKKSDTVEVFYYNESKKRLTWDEDNGTQECVMKKNILKKDFSDDKSPYDVRVSVCQEIPTEKPVDEDADRMIEKYRRSFIRKNLSIDMTIISGDSQDMDDEDGKKFQVELEIIDPTKIEDEPKLFNIIHKVSDILKILA
jgi:hypothetical protein